MIRVSLSQARSHVLQQNYLAEQKAANLQSLLQRLGGLPATNPTTPVVAAYARLQHLPVGQLSDSLNASRYIRATLLQNNPYLVPVELYPTLFAATARQRNQHLNAEFRLWGLPDNREIEQLAETLVSRWDANEVSVETAAGWLDSRQVRELSQTSRGGRVSHTTNVALALQWLAAQGRLVVTNGAKVWWEVTPLYSLLQHKYPGLNLADLPGEAEAQKAVVRSYLAVFGPATEADISFWSGFGKSETARAVSSLSSETTLTMVEGIPGMLLSLKNQSEALQTAAPEAPIVNIVPANDPYLTAHYASRSRFAADQTVQRKIFGSGGSSRAAILLDGQVVGSWDWQPGTVLSHQLFVPTSPEEANIIEGQVKQLAALLTTP